MTQLYKTIQGIVISQYLNHPTGIPFLRKGQIYFFLKKKQGIPKDPLLMVQLAWPGCLTTSSRARPAECRSALPPAAAHIPCPTC